MSFDLPNLDYFLRRLPPLDWHGALAGGFPPVLRAGLRPDSLACAERGGESADAREAAEDAIPLLSRLILTRSAYRAIVGYLGTREPEAAGILLGPADDDDLVTHFVPDECGVGSPVSFRLDTRSLNRHLRVARRAGLTCRGLAHSHPAGIPNPSGGDLAYLAAIFGLERNDPGRPFYVPIFCDGWLHPYVYLDGDVQPAGVLLL